MSFLPFSTSSLKNPRFRLSLVLLADYVTISLCLSSFLHWVLFFGGHERHSHTVICFLLSMTVNHFSWITWSSLTRSRSNWWLRRSDRCTCRLPPPPRSSRYSCPPRPRTAALSTACRSLSRIRCRATTPRSSRAPDSRTSLCTLAPPPALDQVSPSICAYVSKTNTWSNAGTF